jgi:hypothetical protein
MVPLIFSKGDKMKIDLNLINQEFFFVKPVIIANEECFLTYPKIGCEWNKDNLIFRSSIWNSQGELISAGFKKFFNWEERPSVSPPPTEYKNVKCITKIDGSLLSVTMYKGQLIVRTRQTSNALTIPNGHEIELLKQKYPKAFKFYTFTEEFSYIFEWTTPANRIILDYGNDPQLWYIGKIYHDNYSYVMQDYLDDEAIKLNVQRPKIYNFKTMKEMIETVEAFEGIEGICVYYNDDQDIRKVKGISYLTLHRFKTLVSLDTTMDLFIKYQYPPYKDFEDKLTKEFDYECFQMARSYASQICDGYEETQKIIEGMKKFISGLNGLNRKEQAGKIIQAYGNTNRTGYVFSLLDNKPLKDDNYKK